MMTTGESVRDADTVTPPPEWVFRAISVLPRVGLGVSGALLAMVWAGGGEPWQLGILAGAVVGTGAASLRVLLGGVPRRPRFALAMAVILLVQLAVVTAAGGLEGPAILILLPTTLFAALILPRRRWVAVTALAVTGVIALAALALAGVSFVPAAFDIQSASGRPLFWLVFAWLTLMVVVGGGLVGQLAQRSVARAWRSAALAQAAVAEGMRERNEHLVGLTGSIGHELKNPLAAIHGLSKLMAAQAAPGSREAKRLGVVVEESERMGRILAELLNMSRPLGGLALAPVALAPLLEDTVVIHEGLARTRAVRLALGADDPALRVACDARKVKQILMNLVQNALEASPPGGTVTLRLLEDADAAVIRVDDEGPGLPLDLGAAVFTPGVTTKGAGTGLGLTIARALAEQHGGTLTLTTREGGGCRAELRLPARPVGTESAEACQVEVPLAV